MIDDDIVSVDLTGEIKLLNDSEGTVHRVKTVIVATGSGYRKLGIDRGTNSPGEACPGARPATASSSAART